LERTRGTRTSQLPNRTRTHRRRDPVPQHCLSNEVANDSRYLTNQESTGSELIVPVLLDGRVVGTLDIEDPAMDAFDEKDQASFQDLAAALTCLYG
jgi:putative methionine-R-sulfoxide reductase with GAF domain